MMFEEDVIYTKRGHKPDIQLLMMIAKCITTFPVLKLGIGLLFSRRKTFPKIMFPFPQKKKYNRILNHFIVVF